MASTPPPPPPPPPPVVVGMSGNLTVFITPAAEPSPSPGPESPRSEFSTPPTTPRELESPASPAPPEEPAATPLLVRIASPPLPDDDTVSTPPLVKTISPPLPVAKVTRPPPPLVQVPPPQYEKASAGPDGSVLAFFWDAVARVQEAHASLDEYISKWFGLDQSKYQWALNDYYERAGQESMRISS